MLDIHIKVTDGLELFNQVLDDVSPEQLVDEEVDVVVDEETPPGVGEGSPIASYDMTQCDMVLRYMLDCGEITPLDAMREFGIMRLGARIYELKKMGWNIERRMVSSVNRYGRTVGFAAYKVVKPCP